MTQSYFTHAGVPVESEPTNSGAAQSLQNPLLEQAMLVCKQSNTKEHMMELMKKLISSELLVCVAPGDINSEQAQAIARGEHVQVDGQMKFQPQVSQLSNGDLVIVVFTSQRHLPEEHRTKMQMRIPFLQCADIACKQDNGISAIVINPYTDSLKLPRKFLAMVCAGIQMEH